MKVWFEPKDGRLGMQAENDADLETLAIVESYLVNYGGKHQVVGHGNVVRPTAQGGVIYKTNLFAISLETL